MRPIKIQIQSSSVREGVTENPVVSWEYGDVDAGKRQEACQILLRKDGGELVYDTGKLKTSVQNNHQLKVKLETHSRYRIKVISWDGCEEASNVSELYVSGVCQDEDWCGDWIGCGKGSPFYCVKRFYVPEEVAHAYISVAATGQYECKINGALPDDSVLNGSWTDFHKRIHYRTFEIGELLAKGENCISIEVGNGWYFGYAKDGRHFYTLDKGYEPFGQVLGVKAVVTLQMQDGSLQRFGSDEDWEIAQSSILYTNIYGSEDCDLGLDSKPWEKTDKTAEGIHIEHAHRLGEAAPRGRLVPALYPPVKRIRTYEGKMVWKYQNGDVVYDLGQNMAAQFEVSARGNRGAKIRVSCAETWQRGDIFQPKTNSWCDYMLSGETNQLQTFCPKFTYAAGRYLLVSCLDSEKPDSVEIVAVKGYFISSAAEQTGDFVCSDFRYMQVYDLIQKAVESNLNHVHTDCPTIEKLGWQEPNHLMAPSVMYMKNVNTLWEKFEDDQVDSQYGDQEEDFDEGMFPHHYEAGLLPSIAPRYARFLYDWGSGSFWDIIPWGSSLVMGLMERYRFYGDKGNRTEYYPVICKYVDYEYRKYLQYSELFQEQEGVHFLKHGLGDWGTWNADDNARENVETAYLYQDLMLTAQIAGEIGDKVEEKRYFVLAEKLRQEYNARLLVKNQQTGLWYYKSYHGNPETLIQTNQALPLYFRMVPEEKIESVTQSFLLSVDDHRFKSGEVGLPYIFRLLGELKKADIVQDMIFQKEHPSYYRFVETGETTLPEFWDDAARSRNHDMMGSIMEWFYRYMAGISSDDGYRNIQIRPQLPTGVQFLKCTFHAITGEIKVTVYRDAASKIQLHCQIPVNTCGKAYTGASEFQLEGGICYSLCDQ